VDWSFCEGSSRKGMRRVGLVESTIGWKCKYEAIEKVD